MLNGFKSPGRVALIGAEGDIGRSILSQIHPTNAPEVILVCRSGEYALDVTDKSAREKMVEKLFATGDLDLAVIAVGLLGTDRAMNAADNLVAAMEVNYVGTVHILKLVSDRMKNQAHGTILVISSFAQNRPRDDN